jgi:dTDP-L-rhamnose 4-epimerase
LKAGRWELADEKAYPLTPVPTTEDKLPALTSVYALSKFDQERMCLMIGQAYAIPTVALRLFNVYGSRQSISNPYTGVLAIFASRYLNGKPPLIFEDGRQKRDFVSVHDVAQAFCLALETPRADGQVFNIGSGEAYTVNAIAVRLGKVLGNPVVGTRISGKYRVGDIRHCFADIQLAREVLGYHPRVTLDAGLEALADWLRGRDSQDRVDEAAAELVARGLAV